MTVVDIRPVEQTEAQVESPSHHGRRWWILGVIALAQLAVVLDATIVNIALPTAQDALGFSNDNRQWIVTAYALGFGALLLLGGRLGDLVGRKPVFIVGLGGFAAASALGGAATSFGVLVAARGLQGLFAALIAPAALSLLAVTFTDTQERARAFAIFGAVAGTGGAIGLILGGALTEYLSWRWCLYVNVPIAAVAIAGAAVLLKKQPREGAAPTLDLPGTVVSIAGLFFLVYGLASAETKGWTSALTVGFICTGLALLAVFVFLETKVSQPLLPMRVLLDRNRGGSFLALGITGAGIFAVFLFLTYYLATTLGYAPLKTGFAFLPLIGGIIVSSQLAPPVIARIGVKVPMSAGMLVAAGGLVLLTNLDLTSSYWIDIFPGLLVTGLGLGFVLPPAFGAAVSGVSESDAGVASAAVNTFQQIGGSIGTAVLSALAASAATDYLVGKEATPDVQALAALSSYTTAFAWSAGLFAAGAVLCFAILRHGALEVDPDAAPVLAH